MFHKLLVFSTLHLFSITVNSSQLLRLDVDQKADLYEIRVEMEVDAPAESVRAILTDYDNLGRLNTSITTSKVIGTEQDGAVRVMTRMENCILFFCTEVQKVEDVTEDAQGRILVVIVPGSSSFRSGHATWEIQGTGNRSRVIHHAKLEPDLWLPPWMGSAILKSTLRREILESFESLDCLARERCKQNSDSSTMGSRYDLIYEMWRFACLDGDVMRPRLLAEYMLCVNQQIDDNLPDLIHIHLLFR
ncbi:MAG: SRPBCC family protein [Thiogranum sp.]